LGELVKAERTKLRTHFGIFIAMLMGHIYDYIQLL